MMLKQVKLRLSQWLRRLKRSTRKTLNIDIPITSHRYRIEDLNSRNGTEMKRDD